MGLDLTTPLDNLEAFVRARASNDGRSSMFWFSGDVYAWEPDRPGRHLFGLEGYNVARAVAVDGGGYHLLSREAVLYLDPASREVLTTWQDVESDEPRDVVHIWNDPVNIPLLPDGPRGPFRVPVTEMEGDVIFNTDVLLAYPSPLPVADFPESSQDDTYRAAELFQFFTTRADLEADTASAPCRTSWTRLGPWLPWMRWGQRPGHLVYHCRGLKLEGGWDALPAKVRAEVEAHKPWFRDAPLEFTQPNETSWTYFRRLQQESAPTAP